MNLKWILGVLLALAGGYFVFAGFKYTRMIGSIFMSLVYRPSAEAMTEFRGERLTILDSSDKEIEALYYENAPTKKIVIFCHESGSGKETWERYAYFLPDMGYGVLSLDYGIRQPQQDANSLGQWPTYNDVAQLLTVIRWAKKRFGQDVKIALFGVSNGADIALAAAHEEPSVRAIVADGLFSMKESFRGSIRRWAPILVRPNIWGEKYPDFIVNIFTNLGFWYCQRKAKRKFVDVESIFKKRIKPLLLIHGAIDDYVSETHQAFLKKMAMRGSQSIAWTIPDAGHNQAVQLARHDYEERIRKFLGAHL